MSRCGYIIEWLMSTSDVGGLAWPESPDLRAWPGLGQGLVFLH